MYLLCHVIVLPLIIFNRLCMQILLYSLDSCPIRKLDRYAFDYLEYVTIMNSGEHSRDITAAPGAKE